MNVSDGRQYNANDSTKSGNLSTILDLDLQLVSQCNSTLFYFLYSGDIKINTLQKQGFACTLNGKIC